MERRTLERMSVFGELQAPLLPKAWLPKPVKAFEIDLGLRYIVSAQSNETSVAPTIGLKADLAGGFSLRGSYTTSNRFPTPIMSRPLAEGSGTGAGADPTVIFDPKRNESYEVDAKVAVNPNVRPESAATQSAGLVWQRGTTHRFRASLDFADTTKTNEFIVLKPQDAMNLEALFPDRVERSTPAPGSPPRVTHGAGRPGQRGAPAFAELEPRGGLCVARFRRRHADAARPLGVVPKVRPPAPAGQPRGRRA